MVDFASACLDGGARLFQVRAKHASGSSLLDLANQIRARADQAGALVIVNDRADIARLAGVSGVHVGQDDLSPASVRSILGETAIVGLSTHTTEQIDRALTEPISYLAIGPVFETSTKDTGYAAVGLRQVRSAAEAAHARRVPVVAIGGISLELAPQVLAAGASSVAVASDLLRDQKPERKVRAYLDRLSP